MVLGLRQGFSPAVGDIIVFELPVGFVIAKLELWDDDKGFFEVSKPFVLTMPPFDQLPPELQAQVRNNPAAQPIGFGAFPPFYENQIRVMMNGCLSMGEPRASAKNLYIRNTSNIVMASQMPATEGAR